MEKLNLKFAKNIISDLEKGKPLRDILEVSPNRIEELYNQAYTDYEDRNFTLALEKFAELTCLTPEVGEIWTMAGLSSINLEIFNIAVTYFTMSYSLDDTNYVILFWVGLCLFRLESLEESKKVLNEFLELFEDKTLNIDSLNYETYIQDSKNILDIIDQEIPSNTV